MTSCDYATVTINEVDCDLSFYYILSAVINDELNSKEERLFLFIWTATVKIVYCQILTTDFVYSYYISSFDYLILINRSSIF